jgi:hypothetical protein
MAAARLIHAVLAALGVDGDQHELPPGGGVDPGELPGGAEPGLVEVHDLAGNQVPGDRGQRGREEAGGLARGGAPARMRWPGCSPPGSRR